MSNRLIIQNSIETASKVDPKHEYSERGKGMSERELGHEEHSTNYNINTFCKKSYVIQYIIWYIIGVFGMYSMFKSRGRRKCNYHYCNMHLLSFKGI